MKEQTKLNDKTRPSTTPRGGTAVRVQQTQPLTHLVQLARERPEKLTAVHLTQLHSVLGNRAVNRLVNQHAASAAPTSQHALSLVIQPKLQVNAVGDKYEQEADAVAKEVVQKLNAPQPDAAPTHAQRRSEGEESIAQRLQRQDVPEEDELQLQRQEIEDEELQLQRQELEEEESQEMAMLQREAAPEEEELQLQRQELPEEEEIQLQRQALEAEDPAQLAMTQRQPQDFTHGGPVDSHIEAQINQSRGGGQPMEDSIRLPMEQAFGADFSNVRIHTDTQANNLNEAIQARAFTTGSDIYFKEDEYSLDNSAGQKLLAHELTHVVQQSHLQVHRQYYPEETLMSHSSSNHISQYDESLAGMTSSEAPMSIVAPQEMNNSYQTTTHTNLEYSHELNDKHSNANNSSNETKQSDLKDIGGWFLNLIMAIGWGSLSETGQASTNLLHNMFGSGEPITVPKEWVMNAPRWKEAYEDLLISFENDAVCKCFKYVSKGQLEGNSQISSKITADSLPDGIMPYQKGSDQFFGSGAATFEISGSFSWQIPKDSPEIVEIKIYDVIGSYKDTYDWHHEVDPGPYSRQEKGWYKKFELNSRWSEFDSRWFIIGTVAFPIVNDDLPRKTIVLSSPLEQHVQEVQGLQLQRQPIEQSFSTDTQVHGLIKAIQSHDFTTSNDLFFKFGEYNPDKSAVRKLLTNKLSHAIQQKKESVLQRNPLPPENNLPNATGLYQTLPTLKNSEYPPLEGDNFDAKYIPIGPTPEVGQLEITHWVHIDFVNYKRAWNRKVQEYTPDQLAEFTWTDEQKDAFLSDFMNSISSVWSDKYVLYLNEPHFSPYRSQVFVNVIVTSEPDMAHTKITVRKYPIGLKRYRSKAGEEISTLDSRDPSQEEEMGQVVDQRPFIRQIGDFGFDSDVINDDLLPQVKEVDEVLEKVILNPNTHLQDWKLIIIGVASSEGKPSYNKNLGQRRANAVKEQLTTELSWIKEVVVGSQGETKTKAEARFRMVIVTLQSLGNHEAIQNVAAHEFGHMLGFGDEYVDMDPKENEYRFPGDEPDHFDEVKTIIGLESALTTLAVNSDNIMSAGNLVNPIHYLYFLRAIREMTGKDWQIEQ